VNNQISLTNTTRRMKVFVLPHAEYCKALGRCACVELPGKKKRRVPSSLTIPAGAKADELSQAVLVVKRVAQAVRQGELTVGRPPRARRRKPARRAVEAPPVPADVGEPEAQEPKTGKRGKK